jgi:heat shock protein HspQ
MENFKFALGEIVKDRITGFKGVVVCQSKYLTGCSRYGLLSQELTKEGNPADWCYFDEDCLVSENDNINFKRQQTGGPVRMEAPQR